VLYTVATADVLLVCAVTYEHALVAAAALHTVLSAQPATAAQQQ
jgi:hypothetical protein